MIVAIIGSRDFTDYELLKNYLKDINITQIISGGAKGADSLAERYAHENNIPVQIFKPDWNKYGRVAGIVRNKQIVEAAEMVIAFWDSKSRGTKNSIAAARKMNKEVLVIEFQKVLNIFNTQYQLLSMPFFKLLQFDVPIIRVTSRRI